MSTDFHYGPFYLRTTNSRFLVWFLLTQNSRGEAGALLINRQDGQEVAVAYTGKQDFASCVPASSMEQGIFPESCLWTRFLSIALVTWLEFWGLFLFLSFFFSRDKTLVTSNLISMQLSVHVASIFYFIAWIAWSQMPHWTPELFQANPTLCTFIQE